MQSQLQHVALRMLCTYALLTFLAFLWSGAYLELWLPLLRLECASLLPKGFAIESLQLASAGNERLIALQVVTTDTLSYQLGTLASNVAVRSTTLQAYALLHPVLTFTALAAWPAGSIPRRATLLAFGVPCTLIATSLDIPFVLVGLVQDLVLQRFAPERLASDWRTVYFTVLHSGGRLGLTLALALATALVATRGGVRASTS